MSSKRNKSTGGSVMRTSMLMLLLIIQKGKSSHGKGKQTKLKILSPLTNGSKRESCLNGFDSA